MFRQKILKLVGETAVGAASYNQEASAKWVADLKSGRKNFQIVKYIAEFSNGVTPKGASSFLTISAEVELTIIQQRVTWFSFE